MKSAHQQVVWGKKYDESEGMLKSLLVVNVCNIPYLNFFITYTHVIYTIHPCIYVFLTTKILYAIKY